jgi:transposase, IS5 family
MLPPEALVMPAELEAVDVLLGDPRFFEPFRRWFDPVFGRPSIPMETYLRLMFLKYRYRLGYETLCAEVSDSLTWLRFCRIPLGERAPHPSTLMKITTRCGSSTVAELNAHLVAIGVEVGVVDMGWLRADTTVVPADIKYPTDSGLLTKGITRIATVVARLQAAGISPRTEFDDQTALARQGAHRIGSKLRRRSDDAKAEVLAITGELADLAETAVEQARRVLVNAQRMGDRPVKRLRRMLADLAHLIDAVSQVIQQTRVRLAGEIPAGKTRRVSLHDDDARPAERAAWPRQRSSDTPARSPTTATESLSTTNSKPGCHPTRHVSRPRSRERSPPPASSPTRSPPTAATDKPRSTKHSPNSVSSSSQSSARANPAKPANRSKPPTASSNSSNGAPAPRAESPR